MMNMLLIYVLTQISTFPAKLKASGVSGIIETNLFIHDKVDDVDHVSLNSTVPNEASLTF